MFAYKQIVIAMKRILLTLGLIVSISLVYSNNEKVIQNSFYTAYISGDVNKWKSGIKSLENKYAQTGNIQFLYELVKGQYGYIGLMIYESEYESAKQLLSQTEKNVSKLLKHDEEWPEALALQAGIYAFKIILYPGYKLYYGPKGLNAVEKAISFNKYAPSVLVEFAHYKYHSPSLLGGDIDEAIFYYKQALKLYEINGQSEDNWQYMNTKVWLAISYNSKGEKDKALGILKEILDKEPDFYYVKYVLYPKIKGKSISSTNYLSFND